MGGKLTDEEIEKRSAAALKRLLATPPDHKQPRPPGAGQKKRGIEKDEHSKANNSDK